MLAFFTLIHPLVDACSVSVLIAGGMTWERVVAYNAMAFALQLPAGIFMDGCPHLNRIGFFAGTGMVLAATVLAAIGCGGWGVLVALTLAMEWETRGRMVVRRRSDDWILRQTLALGCLFVLIAWRSWAGLLESGRSENECVFMMCAGAAASFSGKVFGGYLSGFAGRWRVIVVSVLGSAALAFIQHPSWTATWLILLFVAQLATGPVLSLVYDRMERRGGLAFGLNCFGLFVGSLA